jgi:hypothetical protein
MMGWKLMAVTGIGSLEQGVRNKLTNIFYLFIAHFHKSLSSLIIGTFIILSVSIFIATIINSIVLK